MKSKKRGDKELEYELLIGSPEDEVPNSPPPDFSMEIPNTNTNPISRKNFDAMKRHARLLAAEAFLQSRLYPLIEETLELSDSQLVELLVDFKRCTISGADFQMQTIFGCILNRLNLYQDVSYDSQLSENFEGLNRDSIIFQFLCELDFDVIDQHVEERLRTYMPNLQKR